MGIPYLEFLELQLISVLFFAAMLPVSGWLADRFGRRVTLLVITVGIMLYGTTFGLLLSPHSATTTSTLVFLVVGMTLMGLTFGPMSAVLPELFPTNVRYTGSGIAYNACEHSRRRDRTVRRHLAGHLLRGGLGGGVSAVRCGVDGHRALGHAGDP